MNVRSRSLALRTLIAAGLLPYPASACHDRGSRLAGPDADSATTRAFYADRFSRKPSVSTMIELGRQLFFDGRLSASGQMSCATCHDPTFAFGPPNGLSTQPGGADLKSPGMRAVPSLRYLHAVPSFSEHTFDEAIDESIDQGPTGGLAWDGRVDSAHDQARLPLTSPFEMANPDLASVVAKVARGPSAGQFRAAFGDDVFVDPVRGSTAILKVLETFQQSPADFFPYSSRYDNWLRRKGDLTAQELRGLALFNDPKKGNCAVCHPSQIRKGAFPQFSDFGFVALGVPRNPAISANRDPGFFDLGLCGPLRRDLVQHKEYCGEFRAPSLRNVAIRRVFFHNGMFHRLEDVIAFYAERDTNPARWYPKAKGRVDLYNDLPRAYHGNVNREAPFGGKPGGRPTLSKAEIADIVAFLGSLTDADLLRK